MRLAGAPAGSVELALVLGHLVRPTLRSTSTNSSGTRPSPVETACSVASCLPSMTGWT
ncbi:hypothetical protein [Nonomuraea wenchangensis]|uniref:hypothetical protein n=1 Tax=Nonomuraea wenchangensis TaxID=568860 RepID=UPI0015A4FCEF|nr:hypothetical protein [Nonomuraea wenchangensis]